MRVEWLFLRWFIVIGVIALVATYAQSWRQSRPQSGYETIPLVRGARSSGMPVRGVMVDPHQRNIYAVVGGPRTSSAEATLQAIVNNLSGQPGTPSTR